MEISLLGEDGSFHCLCLSSLLDTGKAEWLVLSLNAIFRVITNFRNWF